MTEDVYKRQIARLSAERDAARRERDAAAATIGDLRSRLDETALGRVRLLAQELERLREELAGARDRIGRLKTERGTQRERRELASRLAQGISPELQAVTDELARLRTERNALYGPDVQVRLLKHVQAELAEAEHTVDGLRNPSPRKLAYCQKLVELRRAELQEVERIMKNIPASTEHRGVKSFRPVPGPGSLI